MTMAHTLSFIEKGLIALPAISCAATIPYVAKNPASRFFGLTALSIALYPLALLSLSLTDTGVSNAKWKNNKRPHERKQRVVPSIVFWTRVNGLLASSTLLSLPLFYSGHRPIVDCLIRIATFFYACKLLDLTFPQASDPPRLLHESQEHRKLNWTQRLKYVFLLTTEIRYHSFDIVVIEKSRPTPASKIWTYVPPAATLLLAILLPNATTLFLLIFATIYLALELVHTILHPRCPYPLFWQPFAASSITAFWSIHWHQGARPFLVSLGYTPGKKLFTPIFGREAGSAAGVLATFSLSGIWHGWAAAALVEDPWMMGIWLWAIFVGHGVACVAERTLAKKGWNGGWVQGVITVVLAIGTVSMWIGAGVEKVKIWIPWPPDRIATLVS